MRAQRSCTYAKQQSRHSGHDPKREHQRDDLGRALGVRLEDVVDFGLLAVADGLLVRGPWRVGVELGLEVEEVRVQALGGAEGGDDDRGLEGLGCEEELDGDLLLGLWLVSLEVYSRTRIGRQTICPEALPLPLVVRGNGASRPESTSLNTRKAWCGRLALPLSFAVRAILMVSELPKLMGFDRGFLGLSLRGCERGGQTAGE